MYKVMQSKTKTLYIAKLLCQIYEEKLKLVLPRFSPIAISNELHFWRKCNWSNEHGFCVEFCMKSATRTLQKKIIKSKTQFETRVGKAALGERRVWNAFPTRVFKISTCNAPVPAAHCITNRRHFNLAKIAFVENWINRLFCRLIRKWWVSFTAF